MRDAADKGRIRFRSKISEAEAITIFKALQRGATPVSLSTKFGLSRITVLQMSQGRRWVSLLRKRPDLHPPLRLRGQRGRLKSVVRRSIVGRR
jgi:hypothetical protein